MACNQVIPLQMFLTGTWSTIGVASLITSDDVGCSAMISQVGGSAKWSYRYMVVMAFETRLQLGKSSRNETG